MAAPLGGGGGGGSKTGPANGSSSSSSSDSRRSGARSSEALLRAVGKHGQGDATITSSFRAGGWCMAGAVGVAAVWCARPNESAALQGWLAGVAARRIGEGNAAVAEVNEAVHTALALLEVGLRVAALLLLLLGLVYLAAGCYATVLRAAAEPSPELVGLTDAQRRLLGLDPVARRRGNGQPTDAAASGESRSNSSRSSSSSSSSSRPPAAIAGVGSGPLYLSPPSSAFQGRPPLGSGSGLGSGLGSGGGSGGSGRRRGYGARSRAVVGAALSFGGGADEQVQGFLEVGVGVSNTSRSVQSTKVFLGGFGRELVWPESSVDVQTKTKSRN